MKTKCEDMDIVNDNIYIVCSNDVYIYMKKNKKSLYFVRSDGSLAEALFPEFIQPTVLVFNIEIRTF